MPSRLFARALPTDGALHSLLSGVVFRPSTMQLPANASSAQGQCGKLTTLPLRASANTNTMTSAPNRSFSSSQVFRETDTGRGFAPSRPPPQPLQVSIDKIAFANSQLDRHSGEAVGSLRSGNSGEMSLSCTVAMTRDDESLTSRAVPVLRNTLG